ncbi:Bug family tripartite tricarboxylate transporter substrate binding protein [Ornithinimicrobium cavernae]|uniref:Bug family tripartite tricarboxylate transporter substrate binding protein n=1 Tax=Ornithinimicrobium cavernae TaxID=2666047 RepID=UPI000D690939|nr:tripartite tricarboxylate transporter substrate binding protein [Ornithinimicrobium cavernae]
MKKITALVAGAALFLTACGGTSGSGASGEDAADFPSQNITLYVPYAPGGATDRTSRILAEAVEGHLPGESSIVVENRAGGGSVVGLSALWNAKPDGYTIGVTMETGVATKPNTEQVTYEYAGFEEIALLVQSPQILIVAADAPWADFDEWVEYVRANPGKYKYGHSGIGSIGHLTMEALSAELDLDIVGVPFGGGGESKQALLSGQTEGDIGSTADIDPSLNRGLVNLGETIPGTEDIPVLADFGVSTGVVPWIGLLAPPETPEPVVDALNAAFKSALEDPATVEKLEALDLAPYYHDGDEFEAIIEQRYEEIGAITDELGLSVDK